MVLFNCEITLIRALLNLAEEKLKLHVTKNCIDRSQRIYYCRGRITTLNFGFKSDWPKRSFVATLSLHCRHLEVNKKRNRAFQPNIDTNATFLLFIGFHSATVCSIVAVFACAVIYPRLLFESHVVCVV